jgi:hypothetical protein
MSDVATYHRRGRAQHGPRGRHVGWICSQHRGGALPARSCPRTRRQAAATRVALAGAGALTVALAVERAGARCDGGRCGSLMSPAPGTSTRTRRGPGSSRSPGGGSRKPSAVAGRLPPRVRPRNSRAQQLGGHPRMASMASRCAATARSVEHGIDDPDRGPSRVPRAASTRVAAAAPGEVRPTTTDRQRAQDSRTNSSAVRLQLARTDTATR